MRTSQQLAQKLADMLKTNSPSLGTRKMDRLTEMGNGDEVVLAFMRMYQQDEKLRQAVVRYKRYIPDTWLTGEFMRCDQVELFDYADKHG